VRLASDRYRIAENSHLTKHVVAAGLFAKDPGSTPGASTTYPRILGPQICEVPKSLSARKRHSRQTIERNPVEVIWSL